MAIINSGWLVFIGLAIFFDNNIAIVNIVSCPLGIGMSVVIDEGYIFNVAVNADFRRKGVGTALINELVTYGKKNNLCFITLEVRESNQAAISLYSDFGFIRVGERKNYYSDPAENAILMTKYF
ncbi:MAG: ribosomal protein S18-alanine N-acetyltransferase [Ruminococcus sp.]|nr:ribosomal protein S18-alanine N-acetyltransferase [Ruminococcus sp.]